MVRRTIATVALAALLASCGSAELRREDVAGVVERAFATASQEISDVHVADEPVEGRWPVSATLAGRSIELEVGAGSGRIIRVDFGDGAPVLTQHELEDLAAHADNPAADRARRRQVRTVVVLLIGAVASGLFVARQLRLREEAGAAAELR